MTYLLHLLIAIDQLANALLGGAPDETLSARAYRAEQQGKLLGRVFRPLIDAIFWLDPDHCRNAYNAEFRKLQLPEDYRRV
jgi:hypothetical protein